MDRPSPLILRKGAVVRVADPADATSVSAGAETYVDLQFQDGHVERWFGAGCLREGPLNELADTPALVRWGRDALDEQSGSLLAELGREGVRDARQGLAAAPIEIVVERHAQMPGRRGAM